MKALLLIAHGSRQKKSNEEVVILAQRLRHSCYEQYSIIHAGFLEFAEPLIPDTKTHYPDIEIKIAPHLGASPLMVDLLITSANATK